MAIKKYDIFEENGIKLSNTNEDTADESSLYKESSSFLKSIFCSSAKTTMQFNFIIKTPLNEIRVFYITITKKRFENIYYGYDSTAFCIIRYSGELNIGSRYIMYGKLSKLKTYFLDCLETELIEYKKLCYMIL